MKIFDKDENCVNQIIPIPPEGRFFWDLFIAGSNNNWLPGQILMGKDREDYYFLSSDEQLVIKRTLGFFSSAESLVGNNLLLNIFKWCTYPIHIRQYIARQNYEESIHNWMNTHIISSLSLEFSEIYNAYNEIPAIKAKDEFLRKVLLEVNDNSNEFERIENIIKNIYTYYILCEGIFFYTGFAMLLSFGKQNKLSGISDQIKYTLRDEVNHIKCGVEILNRAKLDYPEVWENLKKYFVEKLKEAVILEVAYAKDCLPNGVLGLNSDMFIDYMGYIGDRRLNSLGLPSYFNVTNNPFPWLSEAMDLNEMTNFFEGHVKEYSVGLIKEDM